MSMGGRSRSHGGVHWGQEFLELKIARNSLGGNVIGTNEKLNFFASGPPVPSSNHYRGARAWSGYRYYDPGYRLSRGAGVPGERAYITKTKWLVEKKTTAPANRGVSLAESEIKGATGEWRHQRQRHRVPLDQLLNGLDGLFTGLGPILSWPANSRESLEMSPALPWMRVFRRDSKGGGRQRWFVPGRRAAAVYCRFRKPGRRRLHGPKSSSKSDNLHVRKYRDKIRVVFPSRSPPLIAASASARTCTKQRPLYRKNVLRTGRKTNQGTAPAARRPC